jgi:hypothetical protein
MPVDKPKAGETKEQYLEYCIPAEINAGYEQSQAAAICISTYDRQELSKQKLSSAQSRVQSKLNFDAKYEGINLTAMADDGLEGACWDGWKALGTKVLDGVTVPNCIPEEDHPDNK